MNFRLTMPPLVGYRNIRDFIACTAQGVLLGAIDPKDSTKLLYAAQVATATLRTKPRRCSASTAELPDILRFSWCNL